jgi:hypothetical protein
VVRWANVPGDVDLVGVGISPDFPWAVVGEPVVEAAGVYAVEPSLCDYDRMEQIRVQLALSSC